MTKLDLGPIGVTIEVTNGDAYLDEAAELEELGYSAIWLPGGQLDRLDRISEIVGATTTVPVGTAIIPLDVYGPHQVTALYARLHESAPGRFIVGLGGPHTSHALRAMHDYLDVLDRATPPVPAQRRILAALGPRKLELARDRFAGAIPILVTPAYTASARRILGDQSSLIIDQPVVLDTNPTSARTTARGPLRFLSGVSGYRANFLRMGFADSEVSDLSDRLVDELVAWGDVDAIAARVSEHLDAGADQVVLSVRSRAGQASPIEAARQLAEHMARLADRITG